MTNCCLFSTKDLVKNSRLAIYGLSYMYIYELIHDDHAVYACSVDHYVKVTQGLADII